MKYVLSFLLGAVAGAAVALLFAPSSGEDLRNQMQNEATRVRSEVSQAAQMRRAELEQQLAAMRAPRKPGAA